MLMIVLISLASVTLARSVVCNAVVGIVASIAIRLKMRRHPISLSSFIVASEFLDTKPSVKSSVRRRRNRVEEEEALRTCEELLAVTTHVSKRFINPTTFKRLALTSSK